MIPEIRDLTGLSEPAKALVESIRAATGVLYEPTRIRRKAAAEADAALIKAESDLVVRDLEHRAFQRIKAQEVRRQENLENIIDGAGKELPSQTTSSIDPDWFAAFTANCQDISDEQLQSLWSRVLAGEFTKKGKYSLRTLDCLRTMSRADAESFASIIPFLWDNGNYLKTEDTDKFLTDHEAPYSTWLHLDTLGLVNIDFMLTLEYRQNPATITYFGERYTVSLPEHEKQFSLQAFCLTAIGRELKSLCSGIPNAEYVTCLETSLAKNKIILKKST